MLIPIESLYVTLCLWIIFEYILPRIVFQLSRSICQIVAFDKGVSLINALILYNLLEYLHQSQIVKN